MLKTMDLLNKMKLHFPRWMDIRKRVTKSDGGKLLLSVAEETALLEEAIQDYKKDFFIESYIGREDQVIAFVYKAPVGLVPVTSIASVEPNLPIVNNINDFYSQTGLAYYEDGNLFFRVEDINMTTIKYKVDEYTMTAALEKIHVWNVFDEFATFVGLQRHQWETNLELENRILNVFRRRTNSTATGLQNAILNELMNIDPTLQLDDVLIERPTPENLMKNYKEFGTVIEKLANVNRDVYRTKRWDIDTWNYAFKSVDYIPHAWDIAIEHYQNGVGFKDDLKVSIVDASEKTNARVTFYAESSSSIKEYIRNRDVKTSINLSLSKYDNILKPIVARYKITASEVKNITSEPITIDCFDKSSGTEYRYLDQIVTSEMKDITVKEHAILADGRRFKLVFKPRNQFSKMMIEKCSLVAGSTVTSLLQPKPGFVLDADGRILSQLSRLYADKKSQFFDTTNMVNAENQGVSIDDMSKDAFATIDVSGMQNEMMSFRRSCKMDAAPTSSITYDGFEKLTNGKYSSYNLITGEKFVEIAINANKVSLSIEEGNFAVTTTVNGYSMPPIFGSGARIITTNDSLTPVDIVIRITATDSTRVTLSNFEFSKYEFAMLLDNGSFANIAGEYYLPSDVNNKVHFRMRALTSHAPVLEYVYVGSKLVDVEYETDVITYNGVPRRVDILTDCIIDLVELDLGDHEIGRTIGYEPYSEYKGTSDNAYIRLNMSQYSSVESLSSQSGRFEKIGAGPDALHYMRFRNGESAVKIAVQGERLTAIRQLQLNEVLDADPSAGDKVYISSLVDGFIVAKGEAQTVVNITPSMLSVSAESFKISGVPDDVESIFVLNEYDDTKVVGKSYTGNFNKLIMRPKNTQTYIAYNESKMVTKELLGVGIVNVFHPFLPENVLMSYVVESMDPNHVIIVKFAMGTNWSVGNNTLNIDSGISMIDNSNYELDKTALNQEFSVGELVQLNRSYTSASGEIIDLPKYIINVPVGMSLTYRTKNPVDTIDTAPEFYSSESFICESDGFNKLHYSNVDSIIYIGTTPWNANDPSSTPSMDAAKYRMMKREGIVVWNDSSLSGQLIYVVYTIQIPDTIRIDLSTVYRMLEYSIDAYSELGFLDVYDRGDGDTYDLSSLSNYKNSDRITVFCDKPGFGTAIEEGKLVFKQAAANNVVALQTGYFYSEGQEYYLFSQESSDQISSFNGIEFSNVELDGGEMIMNKQSRNYVRNSYMDLGMVSDVYNKDFSKQDDVYGISRMNAITACSSFNFWNSFGADLSLVAGYNGIGLKVDATIKNGYAYLDITDYLLPDSHFSFYLSGSVEALIGREIKYNNMSFSRSASIEPILTIGRSAIEPEMAECRFSPTAGYKHYLIIKGSGIIDDILLRDGTQVHAERGAHRKNLTVLGLNIDEQITNDYVSRLLIGNSKSVKAKGTEINSDGTIVNSSTIDWGITKVKEFNEPSTWTRCVLSRVDLNNGVCSTKVNKPGTIETEAVFIGDKRTIKNFIFEINDVMFDNMKGFVTRIKTCDTLNGDYRTVSTFKGNIGAVVGGALQSYVKIYVEMPGDKIINDISVYIEYKSTTEASPKEVRVSSGTLTTEVLDTHYTSKYKLKGIGIDSISNITDVIIQVRGAKENYAGEVWTPWKDIRLDGNLGVVGDITFEGYRFFQVRVTLNKREAFVKLTHIDLGVM